MNKKPRSALKILLIVFGSMVLLLILFFVGLGGYMAYGSHKADVAAKAFCGTVKVGASFDAVTAAAARTEYPNRMMNPEEGQYWFSFQGGILHAGMCKVSVKDGKVTSAGFGVDDY